MPRKVQKKSTVKHVCMSCGEEYAALTGNFYKSPSASPIWSANDGYVPICKKCLERYKNLLIDRYSEEYAFKVICHYMDWYFSSDAFAIVAKNAQPFGIGVYSRMVNNNVQYKGKTFIDSIVDGEITKNAIVASKNGIKEPSQPDVPIAKTMSVEWDSTDERNRKYVIETYGYDPLADMAGATIADKKYAYNALSSYCDTEGISEDGHKMMCCVSMVKTFLQIKKLDEEINKLSNDYEIDDVRVKNLMASKKQALDTISNLAKDNNISSQWNKNVRAGQGTMSDKIKEMYEQGFDPARVNLFDIKTCESIKQTADLSFQSIMEQLQLDDNDYTRVIQSQREAVREMTEKCDRLEEENRQLKNEVTYYKSRDGDEN